MIAIKSIFEEISEIVFKQTNLQIAKDLTVKFVDGKKINDKDKKSILKAVNESKSIFRLQNYICNSLLKYEGMSLVARTA